VFHRNVGYHLVEYTVAYCRRRMLVRCGIQQKVRVGTLWHTAEGEGRYVVAYSRRRGSVRCGIQKKARVGRLGHTAEGEGR